LAMLTLNHTTRFFGVALVALACCVPAVGEDYPARPVTLIIPFPAGGGVDTIGRVIAAKLSAALGQQVIVENRAGAGSVIGIRAGAKATPDGYTILMATTGASVPANPGQAGWFICASIGGANEEVSETQSWRRCRSVDARPAKFGSRDAAADSLWQQIH